MNAKAKVLSHLRPRALLTLIAAPSMNPSSVGPQAVMRAAPAGYRFSDPFGVVPCCSGRPNHTVMYWAVSRSGILEAVFDTREEAQAEADRLNRPKPQKG